MGTISFFSIFTIMPYDLLKIKDYKESFSLKKTKNFFMDVFLEKIIPSFDSIFIIFKILYSFIKRLKIALSDLRFCF